MDRQAFLTKTHLINVGILHFCESLQTLANPQKTKWQALNKFFTMAVKTMFPQNTGKHFFMKAVVLKAEKCLLMLLIHWNQKKIEKRVGPVHVLG